MNQHNEHILWKYTQAQQSERALDAQTWPAGTTRNWRGTAAAAVVSAAVILVAVLVIVAAW